MWIFLCLQVSYFEIYLDKIRDLLDGRWIPRHSLIIPNCGRENCQQPKNIGTEWIVIIITWRQTVWAINALNFNCQYSTYVALTENRVWKMLGSFILGGVQLFVFSFYSFFIRINILGKGQRFINGVQIFRRIKEKCTDANKNVFVWLHITFICVIKQLFLLSFQCRRPIYQCMKIKTEYPMSRWDLLFCEISGKTS